MIERINWMQAQKLVDLGAPRKSEIVYADGNEYENCLPALSFGEISERLDTAFDLTFADQKYSATCTSKTSEKQLTAHGDSSLDAIYDLYKLILQEAKLEHFVV